jgi:60 kDa SS-A/Ro ribonucleoprotein
VGLVTQASLATRTLVDRLRDSRGLVKARVHPLALLGALATYKQGHGALGTGTWVPVASIVDALDAAFYASFGHVEPTNKRMLLALDVSGSMTCGTVAGMPNVSPRLGSAAMALITAATERDHGFVGFSTNLIELAISPRQRLDDVCAAIDRLPFGGTDCAQPMLWAQKHRVDVDTFVIYTDNETWAGDVHPAQALRAYRDARGIPAKLVVVGMTSSGFSIADPGDAGMVDVVGFDASAPSVIADFARA